jgi:hypothetical protein
LQRNAVLLAALAAQAAMPDEHCFSWIYGGGTAYTWCG